MAGREDQRAELHKTIWRIANDLRGSVDGWDFKSYVLGMLFYRFVSENLTMYLNGQERRADNPDFDYAKLSDEEAEFGRETTVEEKGFFILPSELFGNVRARAHAERRVAKRVRGCRERDRQRDRPEQAQTRSSSSIHHDLL
jgi:type I restriction enzyme M protein